MIDTLPEALIATFAAFTICLTWDYLIRKYPRVRGFMERVIRFIDNAFNWDYTN